RKIEKKNSLNNNSELLPDSNLTGTNSKNWNHIDKMVLENKLYEYFVDLEIYDEYFNSLTDIHLKSLYLSWFLVKHELVCLIETISQIIISLAKKDEHISKFRENIKLKMRAIRDSLISLDSNFDLLKIFDDLIMQNQNQNESLDYYKTVELPQIINSLLYFDTNLAFLVKERIVPITKSINNKDTLRSYIHESITDLDKIIRMNMYDKELLISINNIIKNRQPLKSIKRKKKNIKLCEKLGILSLSK
ncbi:MAG: hypothetical protein MHPSP_002006, partial [Paramarteilia canceri]